MLILPSCYMNVIDISDVKCIGIKIISWILVV